MTFESFLNSNSDIILAFCGCFVVYYLAITIIKTFKTIYNIIKNHYGRRY